jgi:hypothetical protein
VRGNRVPAASVQADVERIGVSMRRINDYVTVPALAPSGRIRRTDSYEREPREGEHEVPTPTTDNDKLDELHDNPGKPDPGRLVDEFA